MLLIKAWQRGNGCRTKAGFFEKTGPKSSMISPKILWRILVWPAVDPADHA